MFGVIGISLGLALVLGLVAVAVLLFAGMKQEEIIVINQITLKELSELWEKEEKGGEIDIEQLVPLWRDKKVIAPVEKFPQLQNKRAVEFMGKIREWSFFKKFPEQKVVCGQILKLLDREGGCSSVVNIQNDVEGNWGLTDLYPLTRTVMVKVVFFFPFLVWILGMS